MLNHLFKALAAGLSIWESKEGRKYLDRVIELRLEYYEEDNKERPDMAKLDNIRNELFIISDTFYSKIGETGTKN